MQDTKDRLRAFINRNEVSKRAESPPGIPQAKTGSVTLKTAAAREDFDEVDLKNSIQSIDKRLSVLIGQTQLMFAAASRQSQTAASSQSPSRDLLHLHSKATNS